MATYGGNRDPFAPMVVASAAFVGLVFALWRILESGEIALRAGRMARFDVTVQTDPQQYWGGVVVFSVMALIALAGALSNAWDIIFAAGKPSQGDSECAD